MPFPSTDPQNRASLRSIQRSIFCLCLDQPIPHAPEANRESLIANQMNHGGGSKYNSSNRWFDKTLQVNARLYLSFFDVLYSVLEFL